MEIYILILLIIFYFILSKNKSNKENFSNNLKKPNIKTIWSYWEPSPPPKIIQKCIKNWKEIGKCDDVRLLNDKNINEYIPKSELDMIIKKSPNLANKSDFIGLYLLNKYGGTWIDASVFLHKPLFSWLKPGEFFVYKANRFSGDSFCMENFFIHSPKNHPICLAWYNKLKNVADNIDKFINDTKEKYPNITNRMKHYRYLWAYIVGKVVLLENPKLLELINSKDAEEGPYLDSVRLNWDYKKICKLFKKKNYCQDCNMTKLWNETRKECDPDIVS